MFDEKDNVTESSAPVGTLDMLRKIGRRRNSQSVALDPVLENNINVVPEIGDIHTLEDATNFIRRNDREVTQSWFNLAHAFKKVRDEKLYIEKYETFQEYFSNELGYSKRMVYYFINLAESYPIGTSEELLKLGVKKLLEMSDMPEEERIDYVKNNNVLDMSASDIKRDLKMRKGSRNIKTKDEDSDVLSGDSMSESNQNISETDVAKEAGHKVEISVSSVELKGVNRYYKKIKALFEMVESFKADQENALPVNKPSLVEIKNSIDDLEKENLKLLEILNRYMN